MLDFEKNLSRLRDNKRRALALCKELRDQLVELYPNPSRANASIPIVAMCVAPSSKIPCSPKPWESSPSTPRPRPTLKKTTTSRFLQNIAPCDRSPILIV